MLRHIKLLYVLPVVLNGCESWPLTLREEHRLRVFENKVLRKIFGAKRGEITGEWRKSDNAELHALYSSTNNIRNLKTRRLRWGGHVARMEQLKNAYRVLVGKPESKRHLSHSFNFISACDGASGVVGRHPCCSLTVSYPSTWPCVGHVLRRKLIVLIVKVVGLSRFTILLSTTVHRCGARGSMRACHAAGPGSIPGRDRFPG